MVEPGDVEWFNAGVVGDEFARFDACVCSGVTDFCNGPHFLDDEVEAVADGVTGGFFGALGALEDMVPIHVDSLAAFACGAMFIRPQGAADFSAEGDAEGVVGKAEVGV